MGIKNVSGVYKNVQHVQKKYASKHKFEKILLMYLKILLMYKNTITCILCMERSKHENIYCKKQLCIYKYILYV